MAHYWSSYTLDGYMGYAYFFIVMGYFFKLQQPMKILAIKKINSLFIPLLLWSLPMLFLKSLKMSWEEIIKLLLNPYQCVHGVGWFLWCTLWCYLIYNFIKLKLKGNFRNIGILCVALSLASFYLSTIRLFGHRIILPFFVSTSLSCLMFLWLGEWLKNRNLMQLFYSVRGFVKGIFISIVVYGGQIYYLISLVNIYPTISMVKVFARFMDLPL